MKTCLKYSDNKKNRKTYRRKLMGKNMIVRLKWKTIKNVWKSNDLYIRMISHSIKHTNVTLKWLTHKLVVYSHINYLIWKVSIYFNFRHYKLYFHKTFWQYIFSESKATRIFRRIEKKTLRSYSLVRFSFQSVLFLFVSKERYLHALFVFTQGIKLIKLNWH